MIGSIVGDKIRPNILVSCDHGSFIVNRFDYTISDSGEKVGQGQWLLDHGNVSTVEAQLTLDRLNNIENPVILDIGANIGTYCSWIAKFRPDALIYAFEPQRLIFQMLCGNMSLNNYFNVYIYNMGISNVNGTIEVQELDNTVINNYGGYRLKQDIIPDKSRFSNIVDLTTVDYFVEKHKLSKVDFLKIDVEGMDIEVLEGARNTISKYRPSMLIEYDNCIDNLKDEIMKELEPYNYSYSVHMNNLLAVPNNEQ